MKAIVKTIARYESEIESFDDLLIFFKGGWESSDITDDDAFEFGYFDDKGLYHEVKL